MIYVFHVNAEIASVRIDTGTFNIPPQELFEVDDVVGSDVNNNGQYEYRIPAKKVAEEICRLAWVHGVVVVPIVKDATGIHGDITEARRLATIALEAAEDTLLSKYVTEQRDRMAVTPGASALMPSGRLISIIEKRGVDLKRDFNIDPPGFVIDKTHTSDARLQAAEEQNAKLSQQIQELQRMMQEQFATNAAKVPKRRELEEATK